MDFDLYVSELVHQEVGAGDAQLAKSRQEILAGVPVLAAGDAVHIAVATVYGCEYLLTWNCRHIANAELQRAIRDGV